MKGGAGNPNASAQLFHVYIILCIVYILYIYMDGLGLVFHLGLFWGVDIDAGALYRMNSSR